MYSDQCIAIEENHDSVVMQFPKPMLKFRHLIQDEFRVEIPYDDPLVIPTGMKVSDKSWGDVEEIAWR